VRRFLGRTGDARVLLAGRRVPIVGRVTMDLTMLDVGDGPAQLGDVATLIGTADGDAITLAEFAGWSDTLQHELLTGLGPRLPRVHN
jgi:alanine racemase